MRRPFSSRCFGTCHFCIKTSRHGYKLHAIVCKLQELKLQYSVISYLSYHSFNILDDFPKSDITYFLFITVPSAVRHPPSASAVRIRTLQSPLNRPKNCPTNVTERRKQHNSLTLTYHLVNLKIKIKNVILKKIQNSPQ